MKLDDIRSTLVQLMRIIISAEKAAFLPHEGKMYALMYQPNQPESNKPFYNDRSQANLKVLKDLSSKIFGYLNDRRYSGNVLECDLFIKDHKDSWEDGKYTSETLDPYLFDDNAIKSSKENKCDEVNINANDIKIYFNCAFSVIQKYFEKIGLVTKEEISVDDTSNVNSDHDELSDSSENVDNKAELSLSTNSSDEESDNSIGNVDSENDEPNALSKSNNSTKNINSDNSENFIYHINLDKLDYYYAYLDIKENKDKFRDQIKTLLIKHRNQSVLEYQLKNNLPPSAEQSNDSEQKNSYSMK